MTVFVCNFKTVIVLLRAGQFWEFNFAMVMKITTLPVRLHICFWFAVFTDTVKSMRTV